MFNLPLSFKYGNTKDMSMKNIDIGIISYCFNHKLEEQVVEQIKLEYK